MKLYEFNEAYQEIARMLDDPECDPDVIGAMLTDLDEDRDRKLDSVAAMQTEFMALAKARSDEAKRLSVLGQQAEKRAEWLKEYLHSFLEEQGLKSVETPRHQLSICKKGGKRPVRLAENVDPSELPSDYVQERVTYHVLKERVRDTLEAGFNLPWAWLEERGTYLRIK